MLVDTGWAGDRKRLLARLRQAGKPDVVMMTHTHFDHAGNAGMLKDMFSPRFIVHESEKDFLQSGDSPVPGGTMRWTRLIYKLGAARVPRWFHVTGVTADLVFRERLDLADFGFTSYILHTPGHSAGSSSLVVDNEVALVGDTAVGTPGSAFPPWGDDREAILTSWEKLLATPCRIFHPAHGFPVTRQRLEREYLRRVPKYPLFH